MKRSRHRYHYAVRCCKRNVLELQKQKLAETVTNSSQFWSELKKINPSQRISTLKIDNAIDKAEIAELLAEKYRYLYNSVVTKESELYEINSTIKNHITNVDVDVDIAITPHIIETCTKRLKRGKDYGNHSFKSD